MLKIFELHGKPGSGNGNFCHAYVVDHDDDGEVVSHTKSDDYGNTWEIVSIPGGKLYPITMFERRWIVTHIGDVLDD